MRFAFVIEGGRVEDIFGRGLSDPPHCTANRMASRQGQQADCPGNRDWLGVSKPLNSVKGSVHLVVTEWSRVIVVWIGRVSISIGIGIGIGIGMGSVSVSTTTTTAATTAVKGLKGL